MSKVPTKEDMLAALERGDYDEPTNAFLRMLINGLCALSDNIDEMQKLRENQFAENVQRPPQE